MSDVEPLRRTSLGRRLFPETPTTRTAGLHNVHSSGGTRRRWAVESICRVVVGDGGCTFIATLCSDAGGFVLADVLVLPLSVSLLACDN
jgi:hypothetical protein